MFVRRLDSIGIKDRAHDPKISDMPFYSPPFVPLDDFDYEVLGSRYGRAHYPVKIWKNPPNHKFKPSLLDRES